jgi:hypothetical protein
MSQGKAGDNGNQEYLNHFSMRSIRLFLWGIVAAMTLQGFLHADDYGSAASLVGGISLTVSVWGESIAATTRSLFQSGPRIVRLPRALVASALRESSRHPESIGQVPQLQRALVEHQRTWALVREREVAWMLEHANVVGGLMSDPDGRRLWTPVYDTLQTANERLANATTRVCTAGLGMLPGCDAAQKEFEAAAAAQTSAQAVATAWRQVLALDMPLMGFPDWWWVTQGDDGPVWPDFRGAYALLYDVVDVADRRIRDVRIRQRAFVDVLTNETWLRRVVDSMLEGELWFSCLEHVRLREGRVRELMIGAGVQELYNVHERILNASLRSITASSEQQLVYDWFSEMATYAWWLSEDMPAIVRRCVGQEGGDCVRIGSTEIAALRSQADERARIVDDWSRRVLIGMWNALPAIGLLILLEVLVLCLDRRLVVHQQPQQQQPQQIVLRLPEQRRIQFKTAESSGTVSGVQLLDDAA